MSITTLNFRAPLVVRESDPEPPRDTVYHDVFGRLVTFQQGRWGYTERTTCNCPGKFHDFMAEHGKCWPVDPTVLPWVIVYQAPLPGDTQSAQTCTVKGGTVHE